MSIADVCFEIVSICNLVFGIMNLFLFFVCVIKRKYTISIPSHGLKIFLLTSCLPQALLLTSLSIVLSLFHLLTKDTSNFWYKCCRTLITYAAQQVRFSLITVLLERILSTFYLENYHLYSSNPIVWQIMLVFSNFLSIAYCYQNSLWVFGNDLFIYEMVVHAVTVMHIIAFIACKFLHSKNRTLYQMLVYNVTLRKRYQILENIKVLHALWPPILIYSVCGFLGPVTISIYIHLTRLFAPTGTSHMFYIIAFFLIFIWMLKKNIRTSRSIKASSTSFIIGPLGSNLPTNQTTDVYFKQLQGQWDEYI